VKEDCIEINEEKGQSALPGIESTWRKIV